MQPYLRQNVAWSCLMFLGWAGLLSVGCKQSAPLQNSAKQEIEIHPVRPPSDQPNASYPSTPAPTPGPEEIFDEKVEEYFTRKLEKEGYTSADCRPGVPLIEISAETAGDLDGDGQDEVAVAAISCLAGTAGPDYSAVFRGRRDGKLVEMPFAKQDANKLFPRMNARADARGPLLTSIVNGRLIHAQGIYKETDANCCPTGGTRQYSYRWNGRELVLEDVVDSADLLQ